MSLRFPLFALLLAGFLVGCTEQSATPPDESITPEVLTSYKSSMSLTEEPDHAVSVLAARTLVSKIDLQALSSPNSAKQSSDDHATEHGHEHAASDEHDHDEHAGHDHDDVAHDDATGHGHDGDDQGHDHANHDADHSGHEHAEHSDDHSGHSHDEHGEHIVIVGKIGGAPGAERSSAHFPFEKGKAAFVIFDPSFESPHDEGHDHADGHDCHFCESKAQDAQALVQFIGHDGKPLPIDARDLFDVKENDIVVIKGHANVKAGLLTIHGEGLYVRQ